MLMPLFFFKQLYSGKFWECHCTRKCADWLIAQELFTLGSWALNLGELCLSPTNSNLKPCIWLLAWGTHCSAPGRQEGEVLTSKRVSSCCDMCSSTATRSIEARSADTHFCTSQSHPNKLGFHSNCLSAKNTSRRWHEQTCSANKGPSISYSTRQARIRFVIPQMTYGSESHLPITLRQWIKSSTNCKNCTFLWRTINMWPLKSFWLIYYWIAAH